jgi:PAS domain S-box-containing protein
MKINPYLIVLFFVFCFYPAFNQSKSTTALSSAELQWIAKHKNIRVGITPDWPPYEFLNEDSNYAGIASEYLTLICKKLGLHAEIRTDIKSWPDVLDSIRNYSLDVLPAVYVIKNREEFLNYTVDYIEIPQLIISRTDRSPVNRLENLSGKKLSCMRGWATQNIIETEFPAIKVVTAENTESLLGNVLFGNCDAALIDMGTLSYMIKHHNLSNIRIDLTTKYHFKLAFGVRKDWPLMASAFNKVISEINVSQKNTIRERWIPNEDNGNTKIFEILLIISLSALFVFLFAFLWIVNLRKVVKSRTSALKVEMELNIQKSSELEKSEEKFRTIFTSSLDGILIMSFTGDFIEVNPAFINLTKYTRNELIHMNAYEIVLEKYHPVIANDLNNAKQSLTNISRELEIKTRDNQIIPIELATKFAQFEISLAAVIIVRDIRERKQMQKKIISAIIETEEKERKRLAGDLHDEVGPALASIGLYVSTLARKLENTEHVALLETIMKIIKNATQNIRIIATNLSPHVLERYGLDAAISTEIYNLEQLLPIALNSNLKNLRFNRQIETVYFRIIKELLNNTIKYAHATKADIALSSENDYLILLYSDDGKGFNYDLLQPNNQNGIGLLNIESRIKSIDGDFSIDTSENKGFRFHLKVQAQPIE